MLYQKETVYISIRLNHQTHSICQYYSITPNKIYIPPLRYTTKHNLHVTITLYHQTWHVTIMLYQQTHSTSQYYAIPPNTMYMSPLCYSSKNTVHVTIILYNHTNCKYHTYTIPKTYLTRQHYIISHKNPTSLHYSIQPNTLYTSTLYYTTKKLYTWTFCYITKQPLLVTTTQYHK